jgi:hypothetical protein
VWRIEIAFRERDEAPLQPDCWPKTPSVQRLESLEWRSVYPRPMSRTQFLRAMVREWLATGTYAQLTSSDSLSYDEVNAWFADHAER